MRSIFVITSMCLLLGIYVILPGCAERDPPPQNGVHNVYLYKGGPLIAKKSYKNGKLNGTTRLYYKDGTMKVKAEYTDGKLNGDVYKYARDGELIAKAKFVNGEAVDKEHVYLAKMLEKEG